MSADKITVEILPDGTLKLETDEVSMANHTNAENLLKQIASDCGGPTVIRHKHGKAGHSHSHSHGNKAHQH